VTVGAEAVARQMTVCRRQTKTPPEQSVSELLAD
jgi:hypothetical protein